VVELADALGQTPSAPLSRGRRLVVFGTVSVGLLMAAIDQTVIATALFAIQKDLDTSLAWSSWTITIYALGQIVMMPIAGRLSDEFGRRTLYLAATVLFTVSSLLCALSTNIEMLIAFRAVQSIGGGAFMPSATGVVSDAFGEDRDRALGLFTSIFPIGGIIGPILGGALVTYASWQWIFLVNVPIGLLLMVLIWRVVPAHRPTRTGSVDVSGALLLALTLLLLMGSASLLGESGAPIPVVGGMLVAACASGWALGRHLRRHPTPFVPLRLLRDRRFAVVNGLNVLIGAATLGFAALIPIYAEQRFGLGTLRASSLLTARAVAMIVSAALCVLVIRRSGYRPPLIAGMILMGIGMSALVLHPHVDDIYSWLSADAVLTGVGMGIALPSSNNAMLHLAEEDIAALAGLRGMFRQSGGILAVTAASILTAASNDPGGRQGEVFLVNGALLLLTVPLAWLVPERPSGPGRAAPATLT
jgi:EmrB/QacA subfamily drug resistance transporter